MGSSASSFTPQVWSKDSKQDKYKSIIQIKNYVLRLVLIKRLIEIHTCSVFLLGFGILLRFCFSGAFLQDV